MGELSGEFQTPEELKDLLEQIGLRLHSKNRIAGGESVFLWHLAEVLRAAGRLSLVGMEDPDLDGQSGNGYEAGSVPKDDRLDCFLARLKEEMRATD